MQTLAADRVGLIEDVYREVRQAGRAHDAMERLYTGLREVRLSSGRESWDGFVARCREHPLRGLIHQDLAAARAYNKPRGYAGDAVMMDYIYDWETLRSVHPELTPLGRAIYGYTGDTPSSRAVRARRDLLARLIDEVADEVDSPDILSVACGHLREAGLSRAVRQGRAGRFVALDQDRASLAVVERELSPFGVEAVHGSVRGILKGSVALPMSDFIYTAGLYDYLSQPVAARLTEILFGRLNPGGRLLIANFLRDIKDIGYMEAYLDWYLTYRDEDEMEALAVSIPAGGMRSKETYVEENDNIIFLDIRKATA